MDIKDIKKKIAGISVIDTEELVKRIARFKSLDLLLDHCEKGVCPTIEDKHFDELTNIDIDTYNDERAYYYSIDGIWKDDIERYWKATERVRNVFSCNVCPSFKDDIFYKEVTPLLQRDSMSCAQKKYLTNSSVNGNHKCTQDNINNYKKEWSSNLHIAKGIDLHKFCLVRKKI